VKISGSQIRSNERGKDVLSFLISVHTNRCESDFILFHFYIYVVSAASASTSSHGPEEWKIEKMYSDVLNLDGKVRSALGRSQGKKLPALPDAKLFKDNAPAKVDQRRVRDSFLSMPITE
jgi:RalA-binding protein 1